VRERDVEIIVRSGLLSEYGINRPAAVDVDLEAILFQKRDKAGGVLLKHKVSLAFTIAAWRFTLAEVAVTLSVSQWCERTELYMKEPVPVRDASALIDEKINELRDWRGKTLAKVREIIHQADPEIVEEWKWATPVWSRGGIVCTGEAYKNSVKMTFAKGAGLKDPTGLFNSSLEGKVRRAIDIFEGDKVDVEALKDLIRSAVALNISGTSRPKSRTTKSTKTGSEPVKARRTKA
jgi:hypothetical protein